MVGECAAWSCCETAEIFDGSCLLGLMTLIAASGGLLGAVAGAGPTGRRLRHEARSPRGSLAAALHRGVRYYQLRLSARRPGYGGCRYTPTCSAYAAESLRRHGALKGTLLAARRLRRCRPEAIGGMDPVP
jgi:putative membrane protein insertion efficiency factor